MEEIVKDTCLYMHTRKSDGRIFYIGIGDKDRPTEKRGRNTHWYNTVNKHDYNVTIILEGLTWKRACELEVFMIAFYGREDKVGGCLVNKTDGGEGHKNPSEEARRANGDSKRKSQELYIEQCKEIHNDVYDYSKVKYVTNTKKVTIICKEHGEFKQDAGAHLVGHGCWKCANKKSKERQLKVQELFIEQCNEVHGDTYDYSKVVYKGHTKKVTIICKEHGEFKQDASKHLVGQGCKECSKKKQADKKRKNQELLIKQFKEVHGDVYDYSKVVYKSAHTKIIITCKNHGDFLQTPTSHRNGTNCPICVNMGTPKLTDDEVRWIRKNFIQRDKVYGLNPIAKKFNVSNFLISRVVSGESYKHVQY
jgi:hypothetical protein